MIIHNPKELAMFIKNHRKKQKISQTEISNQVRLKQSTISAFESRPETTKLETLFRILSAINLEIHIDSKNVPKDHHHWKEEW